MQLVVSAIWKISPIFQPQGTRNAQLQLQHPQDLQLVHIWSKCQKFSLFPFWTSLVLADHVLHDINNNSWKFIFLVVTFLVLYAPHKRINVEMNFPRQFLPFGGERSNQETVAVVVVGGSLMVVWFKPFKSCQPSSQLLRQGSWQQGWLTVKQKIIHVRMKAFEMSGGVWGNSEKAETSACYPSATFCHLNPNQNFLCWKFQKKKRNIFMG